MITFESPVYLIDDIVVFRDHALPGSFYYLHGSPHITKVNGDPVFMLLTYRNAVGGVAVAPVTRDQLGGAFLTFEVDCGLSETQLATIQGELSALVPARHRRHQPDPGALHERNRPRHRAGLPGAAGACSWRPAAGDPSGAPGQPADT